MKYYWVKYNKESKAWKSYEEESENPSAKKIAIIATSNGFHLDDATGSKILNRARALAELGFDVYIPQYKDGSLIFEPDAPKTFAQIGDSYGRAVCAHSGALQIIDCAQKGFDIYPYMGGLSFVDKIGEVIEYFKKKDVAKPAHPIRLFAYSDCSYAAFLQSHHPDIFRFYSTTSMSDLYYNPMNDCKVDTRGVLGRDEFDKIYKGNIDALKILLATDVIASYSRKILPSSGLLTDRDMVQYFPLHTDMIWADAINFDVERGGGGEVGGAGTRRFGHIPKEYPLPFLNTAAPYILGLEGFFAASCFG